MHEIRSIMRSGGRRDVVARNEGERTQRSRAAGLAGIAIPREESRRTNQRREDRHMNLADKAVITFRRRKIEVEVVNVSGHGVMIQSDIEPQPGERIHIRFEDCNQTRCAVRWIKDRQIGLEFAEETVLIAPADVRKLIVSGRRSGEQPPKTELEKERPARHALMLRGVLRCGIESHEVRLRNISAAGAMVDCAEDLIVGSPVVLALGGGGTVAAQALVRWCRSGQIGLRFEAPFDMCLLADGKTGNAPEGSTRRYVKPDCLGSDGDPQSPRAART